MTDQQQWLIALINSQVDTILDNGFTYNNQVYQADQQAQQGANGVLSAIQAGIAVSFPLAWRSGNNVMTPFQSEDDFKNFATAMLVFVQTTFNKVW